MDLSGFTWRDTMTKTVTNDRHWLLLIAGDVYPFLIGPLAAHALLPRAGEHRAEDPSAEDGLYTLSLDTDGNITVDSFSGEALEG